MKFVIGDVVRLREKQELDDELQKVYSRLENEYFKDFNLKPNIPILITNIINCNDIEKSQYLEFGELNRGNGLREVYFDLVISARQNKIRELLDSL